MGNSLPLSNSEDDEHRTRHKSEPKPLLTSQSSESEFLESVELNGNLDHVVPGTNTFQCKIVLLGSGFAGKSTLFYQFQKLNGVISKQMMQLLTWKVRVMTLDVAYEVIELYKIQVGKDFVLPEDVQDMLDFVEDKRSFTHLMAAPWNYLRAMALKLPRFWEREEIKVCLSLYPDDGGLSHFVDPENLKRIWSEDYHPTEEDVLLHRTKTMGYTSLKFVSKFLYQVTDTGGQRNERKKWKNVINDGQTSVFVYVASLSDYNEVLFEDDKTNRMEEALLVFKEIMNNPLVRKVPIFVIFSKKDVLKKKLFNYPITKMFPEFVGDDQDIEKVCEYIKLQFLSRIDAPEELDLSVHDFSIIDGTQVKDFFESVEKKASKLQEDGKLNVVNL